MSMNAQSLAISDTYNIHIDDDNHIDDDDNTDNTDSNDNDNNIDDNDDSYNNIVYYKKKGGGHYIFIKKIRLSFTYIAIFNQTISVIILNALIFNSIWKITEWVSI